MTRPLAVIRAVAFIDGQNLFAAARDAFGVRTPSFDVVALSHAVAASQGWEVRGVHFYSGVPSANDNEPLHRAWASQLREMRTQGVRVTVRPLRRRRKRVRLDDGTTAEFTVLEEKGIDVRVALDIVRAVIDGACDAVLLFSQDQDFVEVALGVRAIARAQRRWIKIASAFPVGEGTSNHRGERHPPQRIVMRVRRDGCRQAYRHNERQPAMWCPSFMALTSVSIFAKL